MRKLNQMLRVYDNMSRMEKKLVYKLVGIFVFVILMFSTIGLFHLVSCTI